MNHGSFARAMRAPTSTNRLPSRCDGTSGAIGCMSPEDSVWSSRFRTVSVVTASWCRRSQMATYSSWSRKEADHPRGPTPARRLLAATLPIPRCPLRPPLGGLAIRGAGHLAALLSERARRHGKRQPLVVLEGPVYQRPRSWLTLKYSYSHESRAPEFATTDSSD